MRFQCSERVEWWVQCKIMRRIDSGKIFSREPFIGKSVTKGPFLSKLKNKAGIPTVDQMLLK